MKGLIPVVCIVFGLCIFALETHGQPVPDDYDDGFSEPVPDQDDGATAQDDQDKSATEIPDQDDGISETSITLLSHGSNPCTR